MVFFDLAIIPVDEISLKIMLRYDRYLPMFFVSLGGALAQSDYN
jgi:hypothetical protein